MPIRPPSAWPADLLGQIHYIKVPIFLSRNKPLDVVSVVGLEVTTVVSWLVVVGREVVVSETAVVEAVTFCFVVVSCVVIVGRAVERMNE